MAPNILSPTPVTGVRTVDGKPGIRLPVQQFQKEQPLAFNLYIQAIAMWQKAGSEVSDKDQHIGTSYFQITGMRIHCDILKLKSCAKYFRHSWDSLRYLAG